MIRRTLESRWLFAANIALALALLSVALAVTPLRISLAPEPAPPCPWRVSTAGVIHGPESPYRAMVPPARCYSTRAAAETALQEE